MANLTQTKQAHSARILTVSRAGAGMVIVLAFVIAGLIVLQALKPDRLWTLAACGVPAGFTISAARDLIALRRLRREHDF